MENVLLCLHIKTVIKLTVIIIADLFIDFEKAYDSLRNKVV
jgi:hypothetical protein